MNNYTEISKYISELLFVHECVIIPNFGGFITNPQITSIKNGKLFLPPSKSILFNKNLQRNDGLLINYISEKQNINYSESRSKVENFVHELNYRLKEKNYFFIENIGAFHYEAESTLQFVPEASTNFLISSFGLSSFSFPELEETNHVPQIVKNHSDKEAIRISINKSFIRKALISLPVMLALTIIPFKSSITEQQNSFRASFVPQISETKNKEIETLIEKKTDKKTALFYQESPVVEVLEKVDNTVVEEVTPVIEQKETTISDVPATQKGNFYIIAGSFTVLKQAEDHIKILKKQGFNPEIIKENDSRFRISLSSFKSKSEANKEVQSLRNKNKKLSVWVLAK